MHILVTGSSGFIARFLIPELIANGHKVVGIDKNVGFEFGEGFEFVHGNILDDKVVDSAMRHVDLVLHLAAEHKDFGVPESAYYRTNVDGTSNLLRIAEQHEVRKVVFFSSVAVYGENSGPTREDLVPAPVSPYGKTKLLAEERICSWVNAMATREAVILRPTVVFGPYNVANMYRLIGAVARRRYVGVGNGMNIKSVAYVENIVGATLFLMIRMKPGVQLYNYADSPHATTSTLVRAIAVSLKVKVPTLRIPLKLAIACTLPFDLIAKFTGADVPVTAKRVEKFASSTYHAAEKLRATGYVARYSLHEGVEKTVAWYRDGGG